MVATRQTELTLGRRVVEIIDATLSRVLRSNPAKFAEWKHVRRVTLKGVSVRSSVGGAGSLPTAFESSPTSAQPTPTAHETAPIAAQPAPTAQQPQLTVVEPEPTVQHKAA